MSNIYDNEEFFEEYAKMARSQKGLDGAGEWHQLKVMFPDLKEKYHVMSVPCLIINQDKTSFGKKNIQQILELI